MKIRISLIIISLLVSLIPLKSFAQSTDESVIIQFRGLLIADRNVGAPAGGIALNYTTNKDHPDNKNLSFKGGYYTWGEAQFICPKDWRVPTPKELKHIGSAMTFSDGKAYLEDNDENRCYFPLSGAKSFSSSAQGFYWSSGWKGDAYARNNAPQLILSENDANSNSHAMDSRGLSVRCVRQAH